VSRGSGITPVCAMHCESVLVHNLPDDDVCVWLTHYCINLIYKYAIAMANSRIPRSMHSCTFLFPTLDN